MRSVSFWHGLQLDRTLLFALAARLWQAISGPVTIFLIVNSLSLAEQSVYYGIVSVLAVQSLLELGTLSVIIGQAGFLAGRATRCAAGPGESPVTANGLGQLAAAADRWFGWIAGCFAGVAMLVGWWLFRRADLPESLAWQWPLVGAVLCATYSVAAAGRAAVVEGAGGRELVYGVRLAMAVAGSLAVWGTLLAGGGLGCLLAAGLVQAIAVGCLIRLPAARRLVRQPDDPSPTRQRAASHLTDSNAFSWRRDVLPSQWRMALVSLGYHLATQLFPLFLLAAGRSGDAARLGMTLAVTTAIQMLALAWAQTRYPMVARLHGEGRREEAGEMWRRTMLLSMALLAAAFALAVLLVAWLPAWDQRFDQRLIAAWQVAVLGLGCVANHLVLMLAFYVLAGRRSPIVATVPAYLLTAGVIGWAAWFAGTSGIVIAYAGCFWAVVLPVQVAGYKRLRDQWDSDSIQE